ncbi:hypothetical protein H4R23_002111 [Coemansia sp. Cherry 401B]|nr:hypothetical protein IWW54_003208 [Coemansia sp. RSA 2705]KAJ2735954.1 hypothetical protein H4R23_002111 [Coemansia sp. Cherry 401B]
MSVPRKPTVLITNDDGPLGDESPFIEQFIGVLQRKLGWNIRVCIPTDQRSWIAKAFLVSEPVTLKEFAPSSDIIAEKGCWYMASGTPASCVNIALNHLFPDIDLVVRSNVANTCAMASGTLGAAMEAAIDGRRAVALSFAFYNGDISADKAENACHVACSIISKLWTSDAWSQSHASVFNINVPLILEPDPPVMITKMGQSRFGSLYHRLDNGANGSMHPATGLHIKDHKVDESSLTPSQKQLRVAVDDANPETGQDPGAQVDGSDGATYVFSASVKVNSSLEEGTDAWAVHRRAVSVTPLQPALHSLGNADQAALWVQLGFQPLP